MDARLVAETIVRVTRSLRHASLRVSYVSGVLASTPIAALARALDLLCARAEQAEEPAREVLLSIVDALSAPEAHDVAQLLREEAAGESLWSLERLVRQPLPPRTAGTGRRRVREGAIPPGASASDGKGADAHARGEVVARAPPPPAMAMLE